VINLSPELTTTGKSFLRFIDGVVETGDKILTGVDTGDETLDMNINSKAH